MAYLVFGICNVSDKDTQTIQTYHSKNDSDLIRFTDKRYSDLLLTTRPIKSQNLKKSS
jgi:hypothetical protein